MGGLVGTLTEPSLSIGAGIPSPGPKVDFASVGVVFESSIESYGYRGNPLVNPCSTYGEMYPRGTSYMCAAILVAKTPIDPPKCCLGASAHLSLSGMMHARLVFLY